MQPRLTRSRTEAIVAGVCGGLGEYFGIDPVIVRLIFVLVTLTSGIGLIVYPVLWLVMPKAPPLPRQPHAWDQQALEQQSAQQDAHEVLLGAPARQVHGHVAAPPTYGASAQPTGAPFDPFAGSATGQTIDLSRAAQPGLPPAPPAPPAPRRRRSTGLLLMGIGVLFLARQFGLDLDLLFPLLLIAAGILLLRRR